LFIGLLKAYYSLSKQMESAFGRFYRGQGMLARSGGLTGDADGAIVEFAMKAVQRAMAMTLVATALCADRAALPSPATRPDACEARPTLVGRLSVGLRRCVASVRLWEERRDQDRPSPVIVEMPAVIAFVPAPISPFQFRLPPPLP
jgi:hypothetical protein